MTRTACGPSGSHIAGQTYEVAEAYGLELVRSGSAIELSAPKRPQEKPIETAQSKAPVEVAAKKSPAPRKKASAKRKAKK